MTEVDRRLIEETFPVREVGAQSAREKNIRHGHISTLHIWWARRPLAVSRATAYAALVPPPASPEEWQRQREFLITMSRWENSLSTPILEKARQDIYRAHAERLSEELGRPVTPQDIEAGRVPPPRVLDPFAGGGSYPLEALRLGCEAYASDYNPVAVLILKATLEYPQKYGRPFAGMPADLLPKKKRSAAEGSQQEEMELALAPAEAGPAFNPLLEAVKMWGEWVLEHARESLERFYPLDPDGAVPVGYIWARTLPCQNPACGAEIPLMRQFWLAKKKDREIALHPLVQDGRVAFEIVAQGGKAVRAQHAEPAYAPWPAGFDPDKGTVARAVVTCPACGGAIAAADTRRLFREGRAGQRMLAVVETPSRSRPGGEGKTYRLAEEADREAYRRAEAALADVRGRLAAAWGLDPVPDEPLPPRGTLGFRVQGYGLETWGELFNARQQLALITFAEQVRRAHAEMLAAGYPEDFAGAVATYLALVLSRGSDFESNLCRWHPQWEFIPNTFARQALPMSWDYAELNLMSPILTGTWESMHRQILRTLESVTVSSMSCGVSQASATRLPWPDAHFDAVLTDPPYYDNVPYSYLSDFFYVWLKRTVGHLHPDLFATPLTPKREEIVAYSQEKGGLEAGMRRFEEMLAHSFREIHRVLKPGGAAVIVYAHKSTAGWETVVNALLDSGLVVSGSWPLNTEMQARLRSHESAALASSIYIVARKMARQPTGFYNEVHEELRRHLDRKLQRLWEEGIGGADFFISAIGSAVEIFGTYEQVMDYEGHIIRAERLLADVRSLATDFAVRQILKNGFAGEVSPLTRFYVLYRWEFGEAMAPFDEARKLAQSCGIDLTEEWRRRGSFIQQKKELVQVLGPQARKMDDILAAVQHRPELIDVLHASLRMWEDRRLGDPAALLAENGFGLSDAFYRVGQAVAECLPADSKEKKLLEGFLAGRERLRGEVRAVSPQASLFDDLGM